MDRSKLKDIIRSLELALDALKAEVYSDVEAYKKQLNVDGFLFGDYDEILEDDDGYPDQSKRLIKLLERLLKQDHLYSEGKTERDKRTVKGS